MCTLVTLRRPGHHWPLLLAANRDEMLSRPWKAPARHWPDRATTVGGLDQEAGGSWLGLNDYGVVAGVLNRTGALGPGENIRSRGELVLDALEHADASVAAEALSGIDGRSYRPFNLVVADDRDAFWIAHRDDQSTAAVEIHKIPPGTSMLTAHDLNDQTSPRVRAFLTPFSKSSAPDPDNNEWSEWKRILACRTPEEPDDPTEAMNIVTDFGFGTSSSSLIAIPSSVDTDKSAIWLFSGVPKQHPEYSTVSLETVHVNRVAAI